MCWSELYTKACWDLPSGGGAGGLETVGQLNNINIHQGVAAYQQNFLHRGPDHNCQLSSVNKLLLFDVLRSG